ncbi:hypothetical protein HMPREF9969_1446 [Prevotella sp. oral taxon 306 str. F0472]|nr:hypothetical protein HMPREF9969_1446 [Prevotella sp. oral taxon 306 str. F0472]
MLPAIKKSLSLLEGKALFIMKKRLLSFEEGVSFIPKSWLFALLKSVWRLSTYNFVM